jgi:hypothetical protein
VQVRNETLQCASSECGNAFRADAFDVIVRLTHGHGCTAKMLCRRFTFVMSQFKRVDTVTKFGCDDTNSHLSLVCSRLIYGHTRRSIFANLADEEVERDEV